MKLCPQCDTGYADSHVTCPTHGVMLGEIRELRPGMLIRNTYRIVRKLGQGGMGAVYLAEHTLMREQQALKFLSSEWSRDEAFTNRFLREVRMLRQIRHKNVVDAGNLEPAEDGTLFFSMEFVDGPDLRDFLNAAAKPFDVELGLGITRGIAEGLGAAHALGMVHRDIKPENILMARAGAGWTPKIADFGIVATRESSTLYTKTGGTLLTMAYAAPEQWRGTKAAELDGRTDLYALGGVLYEMLTGRTAFEAESYEGWAEEHKNGEPKPPSRLRPELANWQGLDGVALGLLAKDRKQRPKDAAELLRLLDAVRYVPAPKQSETEIEHPRNRPARSTEEIQGKPLTGAVVAKTPSRRFPLWTWMVIAALAAAVSFAGWRFFAPQPQSQQAQTAATPATGQQEATPQQPSQAKNSIRPTPRTTVSEVPQAPAPSPGAHTADPQLPPAPAPSPASGPTAQIAVNPSAMTPGESVVLSWRTTAASSVTIDGIGSVAAEGIRIESPSASTTYHLVARGDGGAAEATARVTVNAPAVSQLVWTDPATGLMWTKKDNGSNFNWQQAMDYCRNLRLADRSDWSLPTIDELQGVYDPKFDAQAQASGGVSWTYHIKGGLQLSGGEWSSSQAKFNGEWAAWHFKFSNGSRLLNPYAVSSERRALCVIRPGGQQAHEQAPREDASPGSWIDPATGLMWTKKDNGRDVNWQQATEYCSNLRLGGYSDWRLATIQELQGIWDPSNNTPGHWGTGKPETWHVKGDLELSWKWQWSSSPGSVYGSAQFFGFAYGGKGEHRLEQDAGHRALCVRRS